METATEIVHWLEGLPPIGIYAVLLAGSYLPNLIPPLWGDTVIVLCGSFVGLGVVAFVPTVLLSALGGALGFMTVFVAGRKLGAAIHDPRRLRWIPRGPVARAERWLERWSLGVVLANRFLAGGRAVIGLLAGASHLRAVPVAAAASAGAVAWSLMQGRDRRAPPRGSRGGRPLAAPRESTAKRRRGRRLAGFGS